MGTFAITYSIVWLGLALYVTRLGIHQRRLVRETAELQTRLESSQSVANRRSETAA